MREESQCRTGCGRVEPSAAAAAAGNSAGAPTSRAKRACHRPAQGEPASLRTSGFWPSGSEGTQRLGRTLVTQSQILLLTRDPSVRSESVTRGRWGGWDLSSTPGTEFPLSPQPLSQEPFDEVNAASYPSLSSSVSIHIYHTWTLWHTHVCTHARTHTLTHAYTCSCMNTHTTHTRTCSCMHTHTCAHTHACVKTLMYAHTYSCMRIHIHTYTRTHPCTCTRLCMRTRTH